MWNIERITYFGQEITSTYNLAQNMICTMMLIKTRNNDTLDEDWPVEEITNDTVVMNPPYSQKWSANVVDLKMIHVFRLWSFATKSKADYALLHGYYHLKHSGVMAIVLIPHEYYSEGSRR